MLVPILRTSRALVQAQYVRCHTAARMLGVSVQTIRNYADDPINRIEVRRSPGGHRYIDLSAIAEVFGFDLGVEAPPESESTEAVGKVCVCYSRVSTRSQCMRQEFGAAGRTVERLRAGQLPG